MQWLWNTAEMKQTVKEKLFFFFDRSFFAECTVPRRAYACEQVITRVKKRRDGKSMWDELEKICKWRLNMAHWGLVTCWWDIQELRQFEAKASRTRSLTIIVGMEKKKKLPTARGGRAAATRAACKQVQLTTKQHLWPSAEQMWKMELLFSPNWIRRANIRVLSSIKISLILPHLDKLHWMYN